MKYIRTKNGIYELKTKMMLNHIKEYRLADTIEELCDLVRLKTKDGVSHYIDLHKNTIEDIVYHFGGNNLVLDSFRYCIETDKGLIYVAKTNDKGRFELL